MAAIETPFFVKSIVKFVSVDASIASAIKVLDEAVKSLSGRIVR